MRIRFVDVVVLFLFGIVLLLLPASAAGQTTSQAYVDALTAHVEALEAAIAARDTVIAAQGKTIAWQQGRLEVQQGRLEGWVDREQQLWRPYVSAQEALYAQLTKRAGFAVGVGPAVGCGVGIALNPDHNPLGGLCGAGVAALAGYFWKP